MRFPDQSLIGDLNDNTTPRISIGVYPPPFVSTIDENDTTYDLLPVIINRPPVITKPIAEASTPQIKPYATADASGEFMYLFPDGTVKVNLGASFKLAIEAVQPNVLNVENGILRLIPPNSQLTFAWRKDSEILNSSTSTTLQSTVNVSGSYIEFENIQPSSAGTYLCEITNDIGTTSSETITLEVLNLDFDTLFYRNLVKNPTGAEGTNEWNANNSDLDTKPFSRIPSQDYMRPNRVDLFGYTIDMMHPRPYQIDMGMIQNFDMTRVYLNNPNYFTRTRYKFDRRNGSFHVKAYQDIDLTDIMPLIKGGVYGVEGVRALFSCYIGNGVSQYIPIEEMVDPRRRLDPVNYYLSYARLSLENFLSAGPAYGIVEKAYVTIEELDNETRIPTTLLINNMGGTQTYNSRVTVGDPWQKRLYDPVYQASVYPTDVYQLGETSSIDHRDTILNIGSALYPDQKQRFAYGQYVEFNKLIIERLNPKTTKVRIALNFESFDWRLFETPAELINNSDEIFEVLTWETPYKKAKFNRPPLSSTYKPIYQRIKELSGSFEKTPSEFFPTAQDPRVMITGLNFALLPILTQQNTLTDYYTRITLSTNTTPTSSIPSGVVGNRLFDPLRTLSKPMTIGFTQYWGANAITPTQPAIDNLGYLQTRDMLQMIVKISDQTGPINTQNPAQFTRWHIQNTALLPFAPNSYASFQGVDERIFTTEDVESTTPFNDYIRYRLLNPYQNQRNSPLRTPNFSEVANRLATYNYTVLGASSSIAPSQFTDIEEPWLNRARYVLQYGVVGATKPTGGVIPRSLASSQIRSSGPLGSLVSNISTETQFIQSYYLDIDFSNPTDTRVTLSRPLPLALTTTETTIQLAGNNIQASNFVSTGSIYGGQGTTDTPIEVEHTVTNGLLVMTIPPILKFRSAAEGGFGFSGYVTNFVVQDASPIRCVQALHANLGDYRTVPLSQSAYYRTRVNSIFGLINSEIASVSNNPTRAAIYSNAGVSLNDLRAFSSSLSVYAYDKTRALSETQYANILGVIRNNVPPSDYSRFQLNVFESVFYADYAAWLDALTQYIASEYEPNSQAVTSGGVANSLVGQLSSPPYSLSEFESFTLPEHLLYMRTPNQKIELLAIRPADKTLGAGTPAGGIDDQGTRYNIFHEPLLDFTD